MILNLDLYGTDSKMPSQCPVSVHFVSGCCFLKTNLHDDLTIFNRIHEQSSRKMRRPIFVSHFRGNRLQQIQTRGDLYACLDITQSKTKVWLKTDMPPLLLLLSAHASFTVLKAGRYTATGSTHDQPTQEVLHICLGVNQCFAPTQCIQSIYRRTHTLSHRC